MTVEIDLSGQTAIVTGAGRGIGETIATTFARAGADVVAVARTQSEIEETVERVEEYGVDGMAVQTDLRNVDEIDSLMDTVLEEWGTPEILINNAALNLTSPPLDQSLEEVDAMLDVNVRGLFLLSQRFGQAFRESDREQGRIINISSLTSKLGVSQMTLYSGTNGGVNSITRGLAAELADDGVTVNAVIPGLIEIDRIADLIERKGDEIYALDRVPLGKLGEARHIADACLFFASDLSEYITGEQLKVDGGVGFTAGLYK
ncbi:SDR family NAD(P)-dependent oxidoreductase [Natrinema ejinorense]|uniref:Gluconate 5-dehydrogenase n=1 Tax=Natrinema ejinorense TaxID=373386 RepID=A0A2A5QPS5_9EURY|nr:SDR family oxidoreductase [Natrinema ejinorense]PCR88856.1 gluconate 5-dehydrogenase [Natrinema ejinorense]